MASWNRAYYEVLPVVVRLQGGTDGRPNEISRHILCRSRSGHWFWDREMNQPPIEIDYIPPKVHSPARARQPVLGELGVVFTSDQAKLIVESVKIPDEALAQITAALLIGEIPDPNKAANYFWRDRRDEDWDDQD